MAHPAHDAHLAAGAGRRYRHAPSVSVCVGWERGGGGGIADDAQGAAGELLVQPSLPKTCPAPPRPAPRAGAAT